MMAKLWAKCRYLGYDRHQIGICRHQLDLDNMKIVSHVSFLLMILVAILSGFYLLFDNDIIRNVICIVGWGIMLAIFLISRSLLRQEKLCTSGRTDALINLFSFVCFAVGIYLGTVAAGDEMAVAPIWMFFFVILIFNRLPVQNFIVILLAAGVFLICSYFTKRPYIFAYDTIHVLTSVLAALYMSWTKSRMKVENILSLMKLENLNSEMKETVEEQEKEAVGLRHKASMDELTGLLKKNVFEEAVTRIISQSGENQIHALICLDIDDFKDANDGFGHLFGDKILQDTVALIKGQVRQTDLVGRFGGDEFIIFISNVEDIAAVEGRTAHIIEESKRLYIANGRNYNLSISAGISYYPAHGRTYTQLFQKADEALYQSKKDGKNKYSVSS